MGSSNNNNDSEAYASEPMYSDAQTAVLELIPFIPALLSVVGSSLILRSIWCRRKKVLLQSTFHRLMLGISLLDWLTSFFGLVVLGAWSVPREVQFTLFGRGTFQTCEAAGFFLNLFFGTMWYSCFLSVYFLLLVRFEWKEATIARTVEPVAHFISLLSPLVTGFYAIADNLFNPSRDLPGFCWFHDYPPYCSSIESEPKPTCERGQRYGDVAMVFSVLSMFVLFLVIIVSMVLIVLKVRRTERQLRNYDGMNNGSGGRMELARTKETAWQGVLYITSFVVLYFPIIMVNALGDRKTNPDHNKNVIFVFALLTKLFSPLQGFLNAYIYLRKQFWKLTVEGESFSFLRSAPLVGSWIANRSKQHNSVSEQRGRTLTQQQPPSDVANSGDIDGGSQGIESHANALEDGIDGTGTTEEVDHGDAQSTT